MTKKTPLYEHHQRVEADLIDFAGWAMPLRYTSELTEHHAVRTAAGLFDLSHMGEISVTGPGAARTLDYALVGRPSAMTVGAARYTVICNQHGGIIDDLVIYRLEQDKFMVVANAINTDHVFAALTGRAGPDTQIADETTDWALLAVQGPLSDTILAEIADLDVRALKYYSIARAHLLGHAVLLARTGYTGETGFEIYARARDVGDLWRGLIRLGTPHGLAPAGLACRDTLRLEAGMSLYGHELTLETTPFEAGLARLVDFGKDCDFVGRQALEARRDTGATEILVGLVAEGRRSPRPDYPVIDPSSGARIGRVTSGAPSPTLGRPIAIATVPIRVQSPGTRLAVDVRGTLEAVEVVPLPFYRRPDSRGNK